ncbi:MAG: PKD domain-containing protein, partial [Chitinophagaceae bacterium]
NECHVKLNEMTTAASGLRRYFTIVPGSDRQPEKICLRFGDGKDTCYTPATPVTQQSLTISHLYPAPGAYAINVRVVYTGGCIAEYSREVVIRSHSNNSNICGGYMVDSVTATQTVLFKGVAIHNSNDHVISYRWTFGDGKSAIGQQVTHKYETSGKYEVCLFIKTDRGCETRICKQVIIEGSHHQPRLQLSPNPASDVLHAVFISTMQEKVTVHIFNVNGVLVKSFVRNTTLGQNNWNFDVSTLPAGIYSVVVRSERQLASAIFFK